MRPFARVVALPDPKNSDFPSRINAFVRLSCRIGDTSSDDKRGIVLLEELLNHQLLDSIPDDRKTKGVALLHPGPAGCLRCHSQVAT